MMYIFFVQLILAITLFVYNLKRRKLFIVRLVLSVGTVYGLQTLYDFILDTIFDPLPLALYTTKFIVILLQSILAVWVCFDIPFKKAILYCTGGYAAQNCAYYFMRIILILFEIRSTNWYFYPLMILVYGVIYAILFLIIRKSKKANLDADINNFVIIFVAIAIVASSIVMSLNVPMGRNYIINYIYAIFVNISMIIIQLGIFKMSTHKKEVEIFEQLLQMEKRQHEMTKETIEMINVKCHDIKHQVAAIYAGGNDRSQQENLKEIQDCISIYGSILQTGNDALDIIITEKSLRCENHQIKFSYMIDGSKLSFLNSVDLCCIFGNALDNAIESVAREEDPGKRFITLYVSCQKNLLSIHLENYCARELRFENGLPITIKEDKNIHGYGTKSINAIVKKYNGNVIMYTENDMFYLDIMFSLKDIK